MRFLIIIFFFSGFVSLGYQVVWQKVLTQMLGVDAFSVTTIVSIFMLGLGLGGLLGGYLTRNYKSLLLIYFIAEAGLGLFGIFSVDIIRSANNFFLFLNPNHLQDFVLNSFLMFIPTLLMGMTLPIVLHIFRNDFKPEIAVGKIYSLNVLGAALGSLLTGFFLIGYFGLSFVSLLLGILNILLAGIVYLKIKNKGNFHNLKINKESKALQEAPKVFSILIFISLVSGFIALSYELILFRIFTTYFGTTVYIFPILIFSYLVMMALGNSVFAKLSEYFSSARLFYWIPVFTILSTLMILWGHEIMNMIGIEKNYLVLYPFKSWLPFAQIPLILFVSLIFMIPISFISGYFPLLIKEFTSDPDKLGSNVGYIYFTQTLGNFSGATLTGLFLLPEFGTIGTIYIIIFLFVLISISTALWFSKDGLKNISSTLIFIILLTGIVPDRFYETIRIYSYGAQVPDEIIENELGATLGYVKPGNEIMEVYVGKMYSNSFLLKETKASINCFPLDWMHSLEETKEIKRILYVGLGTGNQNFCLRKFYPDAQIDVVEINDALIELVLQEGEEDIVEALKNSSIHIDDGRRFLQRVQGKKYDLIQIGVFNAWCSGCGNAFSKEFFNLVSERLNSNSFLVFDAYPSATKAASEVFENIALYSPGKLGIASAVATNSYLDLKGINFSTLRKESEILNSKNINIDFNENFIKNGCIIERNELLKILKSVEANTDDKPITEYYLTNKNFTYERDFWSYKPKLPMRIYECE